MSDPANEDVREWLEGVCQLHGLTVSEIAERSGVSASTLTRFMRGKTSTLRSATVHQIERAFKNFAPSNANVRMAGVREGSRTAFELELDKETVSEARRLKVDVEAVSRRAIEGAVRDARMRKWADDNRAIFEAKAKLVEEQGLWSDGLRQF